jgi:hypothetical protein
VSHKHLNLALSPEPNVHIIFTGICTLLHNRNAGPTEVDIPLLLHDRQSTGTKEPIPHHEAFLVLNAEYDVIDESKRQYTFASYDGQMYRIIYLDDDDLRIRGIAGKVRGSESEVASPCQGTDYENLYWIPRLSRILRSTHPEQPIPLAARVRLAGGRMLAYVAGRYIWDFKETENDPPYHTQAIAQIVDWQFSMGGSLVIDFDPNGERYLSVRSVSGPIVIAIGSAPDIVGAVSRTVQHDHDTDPHFETYYDRVADDHKIYIPFKNSDSSCPVYPLPPWMPKWLWDPAPAIVGSVNCGPDQWP